MLTIKTPAQRRTELRAELKSIVDAAAAEGRELTDAELTTIETKTPELEELNDLHERSEKAAALLARIGGMESDTEPTVEGERATKAAHSDGQRRGYLALHGKSGRDASRQLAANLVDGARGVQGVKAITPVIPVPLSTSDVVELGRVPASILEWLGTIEHDSPAWVYARQTTRTNNAAIVPVGGVKPISAVNTEKVSGELRVFAHRSEPTDEFILQDIDVLASFIAAELNYGLLAKVEDEVLNGDGTAGHLTGILNTSGVQLQPFAADAVSTLRMAALKLENLGHSADAFLVHAADWAAIETARVTSGSFDLGGPIDRAAQKLWGTQVITSSRIPLGTAIALDRAAVGLDTDRQGISTKWNDSIGFATNEVQCRVEGRFGVSVFRPEAIVKATLTGE